MNSNDWVAEHVIGFKRGNCWSATSTSSSGSDGTFETWFRCDWCGRHIYDGKTPRLHRWGDGHRVGEPTLIEARESGPCPNYPFPKFTLVDLMRKLGEKGYHVMVRVDPEREYRKFTVTVNSARVCDTDSPLKSLCGHLYSKRELWQRLEEVSGPWHGPRKPKKKRFVSGEQVLEEYIPGYERPRGLVDWGLLRSLGEPQICSIACRICPYTTSESRLANGCRWRAGIPGKPEPILFANIRDAIKLLQKAMGQEER